MPKGTTVERMYRALRRKRHMPAGQAAAIAQAKTGLSLATGQPPKKDG